MKFPIEDDAAVFTTEPIAAGDAFLNALRYDNTGNNLGVRVTTSGGVVVSNGLLFDADGRLVIIDATAGMPANAVASNGLMFSDGALCVSSNNASTIQNGMPLDLAGALCVGSTVLGMVVLRSFGADAHLYLPGVGYVNGIDAGNWLDTGFAATAQDQPVGLAMDAVNTARGPELVVNGDFANGTTGWSAINGAVLSTSGGELVITANGASNFPGALQALTTVVGKTYEMFFTGRRGTSSSTVGMSMGNITPGYNLPFNGTTSDLTVRIIFTATATTVTINPFIVGSPAAAGTAIFDNISVREISGAIYASNNTTAQKPILRRDANGRWFWEFSAASSQRLALSAVPFQMSDSFIVIAASQTNTATTVNAKPIFSIGGAGAAFFELSYAPSTNYPRAVYKDDAAVQNTVNDSVDYGSTPIVMSAVKVGDTKTVRVNGVDRASTSTPIGAASITTAAIGARFSSGAFLPFYNDMLHGLILIKGTATAEQLLTLERCLAAFQGRTL